MMKTKAYINSSGQLVVEYWVNGQVWCSAVDGEPTNEPWQLLMIDDVRKQLLVRTLDDVI